MTDRSNRPASERPEGPENSQVPPKEPRNQDHQGVEQRWTIYVCPNCGKRKAGAYFCRCQIPSSRCKRVEVVPAQRLTEERERAAAEKREWEWALTRIVEVEGEKRRLEMGLRGEEAIEAVARTVREQTTGVFTPEEVAYAVLRDLRSKLDDSDPAQAAGENSQGEQSEQGSPQSDQPEENGCDA